MKQLKSFMAILAVSLVFAAILVGSCSAQTNVNYLKVKGHILNDYQADIYLYEQSDNGEWVQIATKSSKSKYSFRLATDKDYEITFLAHGTLTKVIHIKAGDPGMFIEYVDINFDKVRNRDATLSQTKDGGYEFRTKLVFASNYYY